MGRRLCIAFVALVCVAVAEAPPVPVSFWAVQATESDQTTKTFGPGLESVQDTLKSLPYSDFKKITTGRKAVSFGASERVRVNANYTLCLKPISKEADGRYRVEIQVEMDPEDPNKDPVRALDTRMLMRPGEQVRIGGMRLKGGGELVIVLAAG